MMGDHIVRPAKSEMPMRLLARRSIVALKEIHRGELLSSGNIGLKRPGDGLPAALFDKITGLKAAKSIEKGSLLKWGDFE